VNAKRGQQQGEVRAAAHATERQALDHQRGDDRNENHERGNQVPRPAALKGCIGGVPADGDELAVSKVKQVHHAKDHGDAQRQQRVNAAAAHAVDEVLPQFGH